MDTEWNVQVLDDAGGPVTNAQVSLAPFTTDDWPYASLAATHAHAGNGLYQATSPITPATGLWILAVNVPTKAPVTQKLQMTVKAADVLTTGVPRTAATISLASVIKTVASTKKRVTNITAKVFPFVEIVFLTGTDYEHPSGPTSFRIVAETYRDGLRREGKVGNGTIVTLFSCVDQTVEHHVPATGAGFVQVNKMAKGSGIPKGAVTSDPVIGTDVSIVDLYTYLSGVGQAMPGRVKEVGIFSHSFPGGPILFDRPGDNAGTDSRDPNDFDARIKDFNATNMASWPKLKDAMDPNGKWQVWGCSATTHYNHLTAAAQKHKSDGDTFLFTVETSFLTATTGAIQSVTTERTDRQHLKIKMDAQFRSLSYIAKAVGVLGVSVFGAPPGVGSNFRNNLLFVNEQENPQSYAYFRDQFGPEFAPTSDPINTGYVDYKALAGRAVPTAPFVSDVFVFERNGDLFRSPSHPFTILVFANARGLRMDGTSVTLTPTVKTGFATAGQRGTLYELRDTSDDSKSRAVFVQDDQQIFRVDRDASGNFTVPGPLITTDPL